MAEKFAGKYTFVSQDNFGEYLKADGMNLTYHLYCLKTLILLMLKKKIHIYILIQSLKLLYVFSKLKRFWYAQKKGTRKFET